MSRRIKGGRKFHSAPEVNTFRKMEVKILPALQDNYMYLLVDKTTNEAAIVDPVEPNTVIAAVNEAGANLTTVLTTHHHWDHASGNENLKLAMPHLVVYGGDPRIGGVTHMVGHDHSFNIGNLNVKCLFTPCHTSGHICYYVEAPGEPKEKVVFTGDTLFLGGCGRFFEGTADQMFAALCLLSSLPEDTKVYCGHEYTLSNLKFASFIEPLNDEVIKKMQWSMMRRQNGLPTVPSTIGEEKKYNPFMRVTELPVMQHAGVCDPIQTMHKIRLEKDNFKA
ncbi:hydroxyacylglutathione hydrolase-like protein [Phthorimaea operculella]|nr:hydroxyacylglutathione hydrolase-like protein [Phthorimaea operculella]